MQEINKEQGWEEIQRLYTKIIQEHGINLSDDESDDAMRQLAEEFGFSNQDMREMEEETIKSLSSHKVFVKKLDPDAILPKYAYPTDSGFDLYSVEQLVIPSQNRALVKTGLSFEFSENLELQIRPKSGLALNHGLTVLNTPGTVDQGYRGEIMVVLYNAGHSPFFVEKGMKIAQACLCPVINGKFVSLQEVDELNQNDRNQNGFGSTGIK